MKTMTKVFLSLFVFSFIITLLINQNVKASIENEIDSNFSAIVEKINKELSLKTELATSSNPYDYIKGSTDFNKIVGLGNDAIPYLQKKLSESQNNGLLEYIMAIAIEDIAKVDLKKKKSSLWASAKEFDDKWKKHLKSIPTSVDAIVSDTNLNADKKIKELVDLGTPALPFIGDKVEAGHEELFPAITELTKDSKVLATENIADKKEWITKNKSSFNKLRQHVLDQK
ncbi:hypothetical protein GK047_09960 [Paenibacillus sp. SYP-B3998]|uniref:Uncharacterized protein n=1 Tax=Paenibacillus sp. SYP-B3998 TaxID=2678564 RepID=A0A6G3ZY54_9BACL|nr:hypothetical protein [Paenibacillus sp. SYP-B3998]NEW06337.1 hypothetical protein [Paenibacillus sp. SYP-B3998]